MVVLVCVFVIMINSFMWCCMWVIVCWWWGWWLVDWLVWWLGWLCRVCLVRGLIRLLVCVM